MSMRGEDDGNAESAVAMDQSSVPADYWTLEIPSGPVRTRRQSRQH